VQPRQFLRSGITASAIVHLSCLALVIFFAEVHPFGSVTAEPIAVDIVTPEDVVAKPPELPPAPKEKPQDSFDLPRTADSSAKAAAEPSSPPAAAPPPAAKQPPAAPQKQAALSPATPTPSPASSPPSAQQPAAQQQAPPLPAPPQPSPYVPAQPDLSIKYHVLLGLPQDRPGEVFDAPATEKADVGDDSISQFRRHLKTCATLPKSVTPSDKVAIKLRIQMTPEGRLAARPVLIEASASLKGPLLMQSAISALEACQPYAMLPADRYQEWKVLDLKFTPQDFTSAS
jgi:hypothetical protein